MDTVLSSQGNGRNDRSGRHDPSQQCSLLIANHWTYDFLPPEAEEDIYDIVFAVLVAKKELRLRSKDELAHNLLRWTLLSQRQCAALYQRISWMIVQVPNGPALYPPHINMESRFPADVAPMTEVS
jgi:hypothetical protein